VKVSKPKVLPLSALHLILLSLPLVALLLAGRALSLLHLVSLLRRCRAERSTFSVLCQRTSTKHNKACAGERRYKGTYTHHSSPSRFVLLAA
jgi:hypothetical protein